MKRRNGPLFLLVFALAFLVRAAWIDRFPPGLWLDEGLNGVNAWRTIHGGGFQLGYPDVFPQMPLLMWILAVVFTLTGPSVLAMRMVMVVIGSTVCALFLGAVLSVESRRGRALALCAAFVLATLHWHSHFSRLVFPTNCVPLVACASVWAMSAAARAKASAVRRRIAWVGAGLLAGLGFYTYLSWYFFLPVIAVWFWALRADGVDKVDEVDGVDKAERTRRPDTQGEDVWARSWRSDAICFIVGAGILALPLFVHYARVPSDLTGRAEAISPLRNGPEEAVDLIGRNLRDIGLMFFVRGDHVPKHNVAVPLPRLHSLYGKTGTPVFDMVWALLFVVGVARAILDLRLGGGRMRRAAAWLAWLVCMSMPSVVSYTDSANTLRNLGATPAVAFFVALGWWWGCNAARRLSSPERRRWARVALMGGLVWGAGFQVYKAWVRHPAVRFIDVEFNAPLVRIARLCSPDPKGGIYFVPTAFYGHKTFEFLTIGREDICPFDSVEAVSRSPGSPSSDHLIVCSRVEPEVFETLKRRFPGGKVARWYQPEPEPGEEPEPPFAWVFRIPANDLAARARAETSKK